METGKRKRSSDSSGVAIRERKARKKVPDSDPVTAVDDAEVEEFFAIVRRMREASKYNGAVRPMTAEVAKWRPAFIWEDFEGGAAVDGKPEERSRRCLDLNADPEPERGEDTLRA